MKTLTMNEVGQVSGGCAEHCWGDFSFAGFAASVAAGGLGGARGGLGGFALGAIAGGLSYAGSNVGDKMSQRTVSTSDE